MMRVFLSVLFFVSLSSAVGPLQEILGRLDPHGTYGKKPGREELENNKNCKVCHSFTGQKWVAQPLDVETCFNCHNQGPHSGIQEHAKHQKTCIACHTSHRGEAIEYSSGTSLFQSSRQKKLSSDELEHGTNTAMLKKDCRDCHQWQK